MAYLDGFDASKVNPSEPLAPIPAGTYLAIIAGGERKKTKNGDSEMLELVFKIVDGQHKGRTVIERLNLWNKSDTARKIAWGDMSAICRAVGVMKPNDSADLYNIPLEILVGLTNPNAEGRMFNELRGYSKRGISVTPTATISNPTAPSARTTVNEQDMQEASARPAWMG